MTSCEKFSKSLLISLNSMSATAGVAAVIGGIIMKTHIFAFIETMPLGSVAAEKTIDFLRTAPFLVIGIGSFIILISISGCYGASWESVILLRIYKISLLLLLIGLISLAGVLFGNQANLRTKTDDILLKFVDSYVRTPEFMDVIQTEFQCCGVFSSKDWDETESWISMAGQRANERNMLLGGSPVPDSCCVHSTTVACGLDHTYNDNITEIFENGCSDTVWLTLSKNVDIIGIAGVVLAALLLLCFFFTCSVVTLINDPQHNYLK